MASRTESPELAKREHDRTPQTDAGVELEADSIMASPSPAGCKVITRPTNALANLIDSDSEPEKDAISVPKPRGGLLSRLQPQSSDDASESEEDEDGEGAYERIKKMLMSTSSEKEPKEQPAVATHSPVTGSSDEDDAPVRASNIRKRIARKAIRASASPTIPHSRQSSPELFVTPDVSPAKNTLRATPAADSDINDSSHNADLQARVERIRAARRAKEDAPGRQAFEEDLRKLAERREARRQKRLRDRNSERPIDRDSESDSDGENGRRLTQHARPTRRAGKKAMEQMTRDQQRISRNMQLQHQAKTKKKYGTKDLFARFGFQQVDSELVPAETMLTTDASSMLASSDAEAGKHDDTPPTSPPTQEEHTELEKASLMETLTLQEDKLQNVSLSTPDMFSAPASNKGKGRAPEFQHLPINSLIEQLQVANMQNAHIQSKKPTVNEMVELSDSESEAKNVRKQSKRFPVFDRLPHKNQRDASSLLHLRNLANLTSPGKKTINGKSRINIGELNFSLATKARQQVQKERSERAEDLRRRGIHIETEEEREKHQLEVEDMVAQLEKAREQDRKLAKLEKAEAKKNGEIRDDIPSSDESEDEDYIGSGDEGAANVEEEDENEEELDLDLSGSEEEADDEDEDRMDAPNGLFDDAAAEDDDDEHEQNEVLTDEEMEDGGTIAPARKRTTTRARNVILDEDDSENEASQESTATKQASQPSQTQGNEAIDAFGFGNPSTSLGLTQMFAGTMANIESNSQNAHLLDDEPEQDSLDFLRGLPETQPGAFFSQPNDMLVPNSQAFESQDEQPQSMGINQLAPASPAFSQTQFSEAPEPTQDAGFLLSRSPAGLLPPPSTIDTVMMAVAESPIVKKKGRLQQRKQMMTAELSDVDEDIVASGTDGEEFAGNPETGDAFSVMKKAAKKQERVDNFNKKTSWARDVIEEQAEESEDEYAGLGGASDDDSADEDGELAEMIDTSDIKVDERKIAAFFAEKEQAQDKKDMEQLYKDIMNGGLRKRRGGDAFDVSDDEDEAEQLRRRKQMQFRQMTKALIADENIGKLAGNPKQAAFFRSLQDMEDDPDYDFLDAPMEAGLDISPSQEEGQDDGDDTAGIVPDSQAVDTLTTLINPLKRKATDSQEKENRPPPHLRRTAATDSMMRKPMTIADVQHSVAELLEDPRIMVPDSQGVDSDSELEIEPPTKPTSRKPIIDRLSLSRNASISSAPTTANMAFHGPSAGGNQPGFRVPSLVRKATSNMSAMSTSSTGVSTAVEGSSVRRGGTGRSNIHAQAREAERRAAVEKVEKKRKETLKKKVAQAKGQRSVLKCLDGGFE